MSIACAENNAVAVTKSGRVYKWRFHASWYMQRQRVYIPRVIQCAIGGTRESHYAAVCEDGTIWTWGYHEYDQNSRGPQKICVHPPNPIPLELFGNSKITNVACGYDYTMAVTKRGEVYSFGGNNHGQLGNGNSGPLAWRRKPTLVVLKGVFVTTVVTGTYHTLCVCSSGCVWAWGTNCRGQLGIADSRYEEDVLTPTPVTGLDKPSDIVFIETSDSHSMAVSSKGDLFAWGNDQVGQCGLGGLGFVHTKTRVYFMDAVAENGQSKVDERHGQKEDNKNFEVKMVFCSHVQTIAVTKDGSCWWTGLGRVGDRTDNVRFTRVTKGIFDTTKFDSACITRDRWLTVTDDGLVYAWPDEFKPTTNSELTQTLIKPDFFGGERVGIHSKLCLSMQLAFAMGTHPRLGSGKLQVHAQTRRRSKRKDTTSAYKYNKGCDFVEMTSDLVQLIMHAYTGPLSKRLK